MTDTHPKLLCARALASPEVPAFREKSLGIWQSSPWSEVHDRVKSICLDLQSIGVDSGDTVALVGDNRPEWIQTELAYNHSARFPLACIRTLWGMSW